MTSVSFLARHRRVLLLGAVTVLLHYVTIDWLAARIGMPDHERPVVPTVSAQLRLALPPRTETAQQREAPTPTPALPLPKRTSRPAPAAPASDASDASDEGTAATADDGDGVQGDAAEAGPALQSQAPQPVAPLPAQPPAPPAPEPAPASAPAADNAPAGRRFRVNLPPPAAFELEVKRTDADGRNWTGVADMRWQTDGSRYKVGLNVGISMLVARVDLLTLTSEGTIDDAGIAPVTMTEKRRSRSMTATHFQHDERRITFSASTASAPLLAGAQDKATVPFQLAAIGRGDVNQFAGDIDLQVGEDRSATIYRFQLVGEEELETKMGRLVTWRLARPPRPGSYNARLDIWLAPSLDWYPVQIRNTEGNGAVTTQTVTKILRPAQ
ncbi:DUF3108 domain-containing protein [Pseudoduganella plicata]|uniref:DUF3108 domain-containing protein n=1 Tax=Pseudoduganella plicata TaxID=321984 RepID=A0A4P7BH03_9BURK|nr:DUF3108 domain-containing protein [Pseudoduganella plicata]QBQ38076.1 DUF3108 domain-containing protein [Pseudoduganella plicata]GGZ03184.1 hypothetical protein GCM10007388_41030 [Pseudoduganella plicata]